MGELAVPAEALYGASTQRAVENFPISGQRMDPAIIHAYGLIKEAAAMANAKLGTLPEEVAERIAQVSREVAKEGVTVNVISPGRILTDRIYQIDGAAAKREGKTIEEVAAASQATIPAGRYGDPQEFADVATFLCSARASYVTGSNVRVDGGVIPNV